MDDQTARCRALIAQVVTQGISDWRTSQVNRKRSGASWVEPERWLRSESCAPFSFVWCCEQLEIDPSGARLRLGLGRSK